MYRKIVLGLLLCSGAYAHEMTPTYPIWRPSHIAGVVTTKMEIFNKRQDIEWYEIGVFDKDWKAVPFVTSYKLLRLEYLDHAKFDIYINRNDVNKAEYVCSRSKVLGDSSTPLISSRICSKFKL
jgi:hypothetical protein